MAFTHQITPADPLAAGQRAGATSTTSGVTMPAASSTRNLPPVSSPTAARTLLPATDANAEVKRLRRELARGGDSARLLGELVGLCGAAFNVKSVGIQRESTGHWYLAPGATASVSRSIERLLEQPDPHQWVISIPLADELESLGRLVVVVPTVNRANAGLSVNADTDAIIETACLLLMSQDGARDVNAGTTSGASGTTFRDAATEAGRPTSPQRTTSSAGRGQSDATLIEELRRDLAANRIVPHYQPVVELDGEQVVAFEALARWNHPDRGWVRAAEFIDAADRSDLIADIQALVFRQAAERARGWIDGGMKRVRVNLKLSSAQLASSQLVDYLSRLTSTYGLPDASLGLLLTGRMLAEPNAASAVTSLGAAGFRVTLEGLAPSLSSTRSIRDMPLYAVKIDRSIVSRLGADPSATLAARSVIQVARTLGVKAIADGVETQIQRDALAELRCDAALGFLWSPAVESDVANSMMRFQPFASRYAKQVARLDRLR